MNIKGNKGLYIFIFGLIIGGLVFSSLTLCFTNYRMDKIINEKVSQSNIDNNGGTSSSVSKNADTTKVASSVTPCVVGIETTQVDKDNLNNGSEVTGVGTGFIVSKDGYIVTNKHVVTSNPKSINVTLKNGSSYKAKVIYSSDIVDLAIIKINATNLSSVSLGNSEKISVGEDAIAIGNPLGLTFERTVTKGIVSAINRSIVVDSSTISEDLIQTDASINSGNSGGPLLNSSGEVIGINTYKIQSGEGLGFAIPINIVKPILNHIIEDGNFKEVVIGIHGVDKEIARYYTSDSNINVKKGILVTKVVKNYGASNAGIKENDVITKVDGKEVNTMLQFREKLYSHKAGDYIKITYERNNKSKTVKVKTTVNK